MWTGIWISWGVLCVIALAAPEAKSIPVVPNFQQGTLKSTTTTKTKVNEVINSYRYRTGYEYTAAGTNVAPDGPLAPMSLVTTTNSLNGAASFSFAETLQGPGLTEHTIITRETDVESTTETLSTFTQ
jgi:hypothetical protein